MTFEFGFLQFQIFDGKITLGGLPFAQVQIAGRERANAVGIKAIRSSESSSLRYLFHSERNGELTVAQGNDVITVKTHFQTFSDTNAIRIWTEVENVCGEELVLEQVGIVAVPLNISVNDTKNAYFYRFTQSHHAECQPRKQSFFECGLSELASTGQMRIGSENIGSWSTKEALPQGIIEHNGDYFMFQLECNNSWYYEISDDNKRLYLYMSGASATVGSWSKMLRPQEVYCTKACALSRSNSLNGVLAEITRYRRHIAGKCVADEGLPVIFNEYMHLSWDSPSEDGVRVYAPMAKKAGAEYYVIDCGWHDEVDGNVIYPYVGKWIESNKRFPRGVRATTDYIRSLGLKAGLWIEPEIVGKYCQEMLDYYGDECFMRRHGQKVCVCGRYFLDFRHSKVIAYMTETIRRMVEEYGADYIKLDYNQDVGIGCDDGADSFGEGLEQCAKAYLQWIDQIRGAFPEVIFETCSSGGMRMDYQTLSHFSIISTSDQIDHRKYPYISGNVLSAVLPEQAAVWSYPVDVGEIGKPLLYDAEWVKNNVSDERVIMNMVNSFLGRIHLASHLELLPREQFALVQEGVETYKRISADKKNALPYFPLEFTKMGEKLVASGLKVENKIYLAVWNLGETGRAEIPIEREYQTATCVYPQRNELVFELKGEVLSVDFTENYQARFFEITKESKKA